MRRENQFLGWGYSAIAVMVVLGGLASLAAVGESDDEKSAVAAWIDPPNWFWFALSGWLVGSGGLIGAGAYRGLRRRSHPRKLVLLGLLLIAIPTLLFGIGVVFLLVALSLLLWHPRSPAPEIGARLAAPRADSPVDR